MPQQTDVLDVGGAAISPAIVERPAAPVIDHDLFEDPDVFSGPVAVVEPVTVRPVSADVLLEVAAAPAAVRVSDPEPPPVAEAPTPELQPAPVQEQTVIADLLAEVPAAVPQKHAPVVEPASLGLSVTLEQLEASRGRPAGKKPKPVNDLVEDAPVEEPVAASADAEPEEFAEPVGAGLLEVVDDEAATDPTTDADSAAPVHEDTDVDAAASTVAANVTATGGDEPVASVEATSAVVPTEVAPVTADVAPAPAAAAAAAAVPPAEDPALDTHTVSAKTTATYSDIQNSEQQFEGLVKVKKFPLIDPDQRWVMVVAVIALSGILAANLTSSFTSVYSEAANIGFPHQVQWLPVISLDVAIVGFSWALMVFKARGDKVWTTRLYLSIFTGFSVVANFLHTFTFWHEHLITPQSIYGVVFSGSIPLWSLVATEELIRLVFIRRNRIKSKKESK
ncbi:hypothetical protein [Curtobacterium sp. MCBD17_040]|uniref:hypothetical protein n=1 Tax=Curtobacterium sp. MCBD17_040 TaxID=2175674 RepID=UPI000DAA3F08|nr:hypothetical protein [Curtobacterium sp. MCBD17_040]WIB65715.1 hypothetical protein DEI94_16470 [Curtobacterium sp. MCBD17_040]